MPVRRRLAATLMIVATAACSDPFEAAPAEGDAQSIPNEPDANADGAAQPEAMQPDDVGLADALDGETTLVPPVAKDLLLWLRADAGVIELKGTITTWADQSGHHSDAVQTDSTMQPKLGARGPSARAAVMFDTDDFMSLPAGFDDFSLGISMFAVYSSDAAMCADALDFSNGTEIDDITLGRQDGHVHYEVSANDVVGDEIPAGVPTLASVVHSPDQTVQIRVNGAPFTEANFELPASVTRLSNVVGRSLYTACGTLNGGISEALVYGRALDGDERTRVEAYLQTRWGCCR